MSGVAAFDVDSGECDGGRRCDTWDSSGVGDTT